MHVNRELDFESSEYEKLESKPHIVLCSTIGHRERTEWRCSVDWFKSRGFMQGGEGGNLIFHVGKFYQQAYSQALRWAKKLGLPFVKSGGAGAILVWVPDKKQTNEQRGLLFQLQTVKSEKGFKKIEARISSGRN